MRSLSSGQSAIAARWFRLRCVRNSIVWRSAVLPGSAPSWIRARKRLWRRRVLSRAWRVDGEVGNLVRMTRKMPTTDSVKSRRGAPAVKRLPGHWLLQDAKARFSELVRKVRSEGPQHVSVHGRDEVVVISVEDYRRLQGRRTGADLVAVMQACPHPEIELV